MENNTVSGKLAKNKLEEILAINGSPILSVTFQELGGEEVKKMVAPYDNHLDKWLFLSVASTGGSLPVLFRNIKCLDLEDAG